MLLANDVAKKRYLFEKSKYYNYLRHCTRQIERTVLGLFPQWIKIDRSYILEHLTSQEARLFFSMDIRDQHHGLVVAKQLQALSPHASRELIGAALLHDIGKSITTYRLYERIFVHLYRRHQCHHIASYPKYRGVKGVLQQKFYHPLYGAELLRRHRVNGRLCQLVEMHHEPEGDSEAALLKLVDEAF